MLIENYGWFFNSSLACVENRSARGPGVRHLRRPAFGFVYLPQVIRTARRTPYLLCMTSGQLGLKKGRDARARPRLAVALVHTTLATCGPGPLPDGATKDELELGPWKIFIEA